MNTHQLVCPFDMELLDKLRGRGLVIRCDNIAELPHIEACLADAHQLQAILIDSDQPLAALLPFSSSWSVCLDLHVSGMGLYRDIAPHIEQLRSSRLKIFMPAAIPENITAMRILSSVGVSCGLSFDSRTPDWEKVSDLMCYAVYGKYPHAPIEPFSFITAHYQPNAQLDFGSVYLDDTSKYLHISKEGCIASSCPNLERNHFISRDLAELDVIADNADYQKDVVHHPSFTIFPLWIIRAL